VAIANALQLEAAQRFSRVRETNFTKLGEDIGRSFLQKKLVSEFGYISAFSDSSDSKLNDVENDTKFRTFTPSPPSVKIRGGVGEISIPNVEALPTTEPPEYI